MKKFLQYFVIILGILFIIFGLVGLIYGPTEIYCFYLFSPGGPFNYPDFGFGSLWFGYLLLQNLGYYAVAAVFLPLGWGFLKQRRWAYNLVKLYIWIWLMAGTYMIINIIGILTMSNITTLLGVITRFQIIIILILGLFLLIGLPVLLLLITKRSRLSAILSQSTENSVWVEKTPLPLLGLYLSYLLLILGFHILIFFQSIIPAFGEVMVGRPPVYVITVLVTLTVIILFGLIKKHKLAWVASIIFLTTMLISTLTSFWGLTLSDLFDLMTLPTSEIDSLQTIPILNNLSPLLIYAYPLLIILLLTIISWKNFFKNSEVL
jgi:hypothetical protein